MATEKYLIMVNGILIMTLPEILYFPTFGINGSCCSPGKRFSINFSKAKTNFCLSLHYNADNSYLFVNGKEIFKFKADNKNVNFPTQYCLGIISNGFSAGEPK